MSTGADCFAPPARLTTVAEALARLRARTVPADLEVETVPLAAAAGRILAHDLHATMASPPFDSIAVDGWAFAHADLAGTDGGFTVRPGRAAAGHPFPATLRRGEALRVLTGAPLPDGADSVAMDEACAVDGDRVRVPLTTPAHANRRPAGEDVQPGDRLLATGRILTPADLGLAAQLGRPALPVFRRLRVALASCGDELQQPGLPLTPGAIYDANRFVLRPVLERCGFAVTDLGVLPDDAHGVAHALHAAAATHDALVVSGGVSNGETDHVGRTLAQKGRLDVWRLAMKPGRPLALGWLDAALVIGLPGNPVAATVGAVRFARPVLLRRAGAPWLEPSALPLPAGFALTKTAGRTEYLRGQLVAGCDGPTVALLAKQGSAMLHSLSAATGLIELDDTVTRVAAGDRVRWLPFTDLGLG